MEPLVTSLLVVIIIIITCIFYFNFLICFYFLLYFSSFYFFVSVCAVQCCLFVMCGTLKNYKAVMLMFSHSCGYYYPYPALSHIFNKTAAKRSTLLCLLL